MSKISVLLVPNDSPASFINPETANGEPSMFAKVEKVWPIDEFGWLWWAVPSKLKKKYIWFHDNAKVQIFAHGQ